MNLDEKFKTALKFHKKNAPGIYLGVLMIEKMKKYFKFSGKVNFVTETLFCAPDPIQILEKCTIGNRYLRLRTQSGRFAITMFDRETGKGIRAYINMKKVDKEKMPFFYGFITRTRDLTKISRQEHNKKVIEEIKKYHDKIIALQYVTVKLPPKEPMLPTRICKKCGELFLTEGSEECCYECANPEKSYYRIEGEVIE